MPLQHVVMWKLKETADGRSARENALIMKKSLENLWRLMPETIMSIKVHLDMSLSEGSFDVMLTLVVKDRKALKDYLNSPYHEMVSGFITKVRKTRVVMDISC